MLLAAGHSLKLHCHRPGCGTTQGRSQLQAPPHADPRLLSDPLVEVDCPFDTPAGGAGVGARRAFDAPAARAVVHEFDLLGQLGGTGQNAARVDSGSRSLLREYLRPWQCWSTGDCVRRAAEKHHAADF